MGQQRVSLLLIAALAGFSPATAHYAQPASASPTPVVSFVMNSPVLAQQAAGVWTTSIVVDSSPACLQGLSYELVTTSPADVVLGKPTQVTLLGPDGLPKGKGTPVNCGQAMAQGNEVDLRFKVAFKTAPLGATLVLRQPAGLAVLPAISLTVRRQVTLTYYLWIPIWCGIAMALLFMAAVILLFAHHSDGERFWQRFRNRFGKQFWRRPIFASAAWTFKDSWATNVTLGVATTGAILSTLGASSTLFPGVQLDRFAILMAACAAIIAIPPLIFGIFNALWSGSYATLPDDSMVEPPAQPPPGQNDFVCLLIPAGASITLPAGTRLPQDGAIEHEVAAATTIQIPSDPARSLKLRGGWIALPGDATITLSGGGTIQIDTPLTVLPAPKDVPQDEKITVGPDGALVKVTGVADVTLPPGTQILTPQSTTRAGPAGTAQPGLKSEITVKIPSAGNVIKADMRSIAPAALVTMFGIGAQLGILAVMAYYLSAETGPVRASTVGVLVIAALIVLGYAGLTTRALADTRPGSALSASATSFIY